MAIELTVVHIQMFSTLGYRLKGRKAPWAVNNSIHQKKLNFAIAEQIRVDRSNGMTYAKLSEKYGVSAGLLDSVISKKKYTK